MEKRKIILTLLLASITWLCSPTATAAQNARKFLLDATWRFSLGDNPKASNISFDDSKWRTLTLPHDWSIEQQIDKDAPAGNDGGYYPTGIGWYRKEYVVPASMKGEKIFLYFEGIYMNSSIYINGKLVGGHPYGYTSFFCDATQAIIPGKKNIIAVRVDNSQQKNCRWYSGSGIYRHVWLIHTPKLYIGNWGVQIHTPQISDTEATVEINTLVKNETNHNKKIKVVTQLSGTSQANTIVTIAANSEQRVKQLLHVKSPKLWNLTSPHLYEAQISICENNKVIDNYSQKFGIRSIRYSNKGFLLNGKKLNITGGCLHHDNGILGAAAFDRAEARKARLMKEAGFNAVRTSHNLPSEAFLNACDSLGLLVIDEAFDGWRDAKNKHDYSTLFDKYWQEDVEGMVLRDINHPSIIAWSIGNEVIERKKLEVITTARKLANKIREYDNRPITSALASWDKDWEIYDPLAAEHDIVGYNYMIHKHEEDHKRVPNRVMWQTESYPKDAFKNWTLVNDLDYIIGDFVWTSIDYIGESGIGRWWYDGDVPGEHYHRPLFPWHAAYCGDIDLTGWRKPISHYRSMLYNDTEKLYLAVKEPDGYKGKINTGLWAVWPTWESWNWPGWEGKNIEVEVYSRYPIVRLYLDDHLIGEKAVNRNTEMKAVFTIPYQEGTLKVEGIENGTIKESKTLSSASAPAAIRLTAGNKDMIANGEDLAFVQVEVIDKNGNLCPNAEIKLSAAVTGQGSLAAMGNANIKDTDSYVNNTHKTWKGRALVIVRSSHKKGKAALSIKADGIKGATVSLRIK